MRVVVFDAMNGKTRLKPMQRAADFRPIILIWGIVAILLVSFFCLGSRQVAGLNEQAAPQAVAQTIVPPASRPNAVSVTTSTPLQSQQPAVHPTVQTANCSPYTRSMTPSMVNLADAPDGLTKNIDAPAHYTIYGSEASTLRDQIRRCAPKSDNGSVEFTAQTSYRITWQYSYVRDGENSCHVAHAKVGLHVMQAMPLWQPNIAATPALRGQWRAFMIALTTHENGHTAIDTEYAQMLLDDLNAFPSTPCDQLVESVRHLTDADTTLLDQANDNYDSSTNHGATQGAILP